MCIRDSIKEEKSELQSHKIKLETSINKSLNINFEILEEHINVIPPLSDYECEEDIEKYIKKEELTEIDMMESNVNLGVMTEAALSKERYIKNVNSIQSQNMERVSMNKSKSVVHEFNDMNLEESLIELKLPDSIIR